MMMGVGNNQNLENNTFQENLQCLAAYREIFNQAAFEYIEVILQGFINDIKYLIVKVDSKDSFEKCKESMVNFCFCYAPLTKRLREYCKCLINGAS